jgi:hypothetical protein
MVYSYVMLLALPLGILTLFRFSLMQKCAIAYAHMHGQLI